MNYRFFTTLSILILVESVFILFCGCVHSGENMVIRDQQIRTEDRGAQLNVCLDKLQSNLQEPQHDEESVEWKSSNIPNQPEETGKRELTDEYRVIPSLWPVEGNCGYISSGFGSLRSKGGGGGRFHKGIDIIVPSGSKVIATADGIVRCARRMSGYGNIVVIEHKDGLFSAYAHLSDILVKEGSSVTQGSVIGYSGATGRVTTPHLHYEVRKDEIPINPVWFLPATD